MRVLHVYRTFFPDSQGGLEETIRQICISTRRLGVESRVFSLSTNPTPNPVEISGIKVYRAKRHMEIASCSISLTAIAQFKRLVNWADVVHYHFPWPFADLLQQLAQPAKPSVLTYHSDIVRQRALKLVYQPLMSRFLQSTDRIVCTSPNYFATSDTLIRFQDKVEVIPIGLDFATYPTPDEADIENMEKEYGSGFFLFIGVLRYYKGLHILIDAMKGAPYNVVIAGSGPTEDSLREQANRANLKNVRFGGYVSDVEKVALLKLCKAIVFPSFLRSEAFGVTLLEGAMFSKPMVSTEVGSGTSHVNIDKETGYVVSPGSSKDLRFALDQLHMRPEVARMMGRKARKRYEALFTGTLMGERYNQLYIDITDGTSSRERLPGNNQKLLKRAQ